jgi:hypothetical protein
MSFHFNIQLAGTGRTVGMTTMIRDRRYRIRTPAGTIYKGKAIALQAWTGPEASRRLRLPHFMTIGT